MEQVRPLRPLPGFKSLQTHHCVTGSMRHVYVYNDHDVSEEMLLGLGAGVGFVYWHQKDIPLFNTFIMIDATGGTGGGLFRTMFGRFLGEAAVITREQRLAEIGENFRRIGDRWQDAAELFLQASEAADPAGLLPEASALLRELADREENTWAQLQD